jgi:Spy/CpxP family protein refolding chaperone
MSLTLSDQAQESTIAFDALAFLTGSACCDTFLPPGKVADYAGFQYLRDNDATQMGHNTDFVTRISDNVLVTLNSDQIARFAALARSESPLTVRYGYMRFPLMTAFRAQLEGTAPAGSSGLDKAAVMDYSAKLYDVDASISINRAKTYADVIRSLNQTQRQYLDRMASQGMAAMPVADASGVLKSSGQGDSVAMRTYASEMFSWYAGSVEADTYFCPERQATYFGSFYMKDRPAMGNPGYSISTTLTGDSGQQFISLLTPEQASRITELVDLQRADLNEIVSTRQAIATELRRALDGNTIDESLVRTLSARYGELDGEISYLYATHFADVGTTLTDDQKTKMVALRNLDGYRCEGAYLYSQPVSMPRDIPVNFLFGSGRYDSSQMTSWISGLQQSVRTPAVTSSQTRPGAGQGTPPSRQPTKDPKKGTPAPTVKGPTRQGPISGGTVSGQGNTLTPGTNPPQGNVGTRGTPSAGGQNNRMPPEEIITRLEQKGYDVTGVKALLAIDDRKGLKAWLDTFKKENPGVVEAIEGNQAHTRNPVATLAPGAAKQGGSQTGQTKNGEKDILDSIQSWISVL